MEALMYPDIPSSAENKFNEIAGGAIAYIDIDFPGFGNAHEARPPCPDPDRIT